jgi:ketopantoate reductase
MLYVIGAGRVGTALQLASPDKVQVFTREDSLEKLSELKNEDLVMIASRNDSLASIHSSLPVSAKAKSVFIQNGMLSPFLEKLSPSYAARAILYFAVSKKGEEAKPGGDTLVCGEKAELLQSYFEQMNIPSKVVSKDEMAKVEMEKLLWNSIMGLLGEYYEESVGETVEKHWDVVDGLLEELLPIIKKETEISFALQEISESLKAYSKEVAHFNARIKEWEWRNQWFFTAMQNTQLPAPKWQKLHGELNYN